MITRVFIADDQEAFRVGLRALLSTLPGIVVCGEAANGRDAIESALRVRPDVVLMDIRMPVMDGVAATRELRARWPESKILVLTTFDDDHLIRAAIAAGASGYVLKDTPADDLAELITLTRKGYASFGPGIVRIDRRHPSPIDDPMRLLGGLTARERDVLRELGTGAGNKDIAASLGLSDGTVRNYMTRILTHLNVHSRTAAALIARRILDGDLGEASSD